MTAKDYLCKIKSDREYIRQLQARKESLHISYSGISGIDYSKDKIQSSPVNTLEQRAWDMLERMQEIDDKIIELSLNIDKKLQEIHEIGNSLYSQLLYMRYAEYKTFEQIAVDLSYDYFYVCRTHGEALRVFTAQYLNQDK
jgi:hypothetical protein